MEPSSPTRVDLMCLSLIILLLTDLTFSITNFGSGFPEPNGTKQIHFFKKINI